MKRIQHSSKAQQYSYIVRERTQLRARRMGPIKRLIARYKFHFFYTRYPEDILEVAVIIGIPLIPLMVVGLIICTILGGIREMIRFHEILYWATKFKMPDRTRYSLVYSHGETIKTILPEDQAKLDKKQKRVEKLQQLKEKRLLKRTLAKH